MPSNVSPSLSLRAHSLWRNELFRVSALLLIASLAVAPFISVRADVEYFWLRWMGVTAGGTRPWNMYLVYADCDYPPIIIYLLDVTQWLRVHFHLNASATLLLIKLPNIVAHLAGVLVSYVSFRPLLGRSKAIAAAGVYAACYPLFINAAMWGQYEALLSLPMLGAVLLLLNDSPLWAGAVFGSALSVKVQAVVIAPVLLIYTLRRFGPRTAAAAVSSCLLITILFASPAVAGGAGPRVWAAFHEAIGRYHVLEANAYNLWSLVILDRQFIQHLTYAAAISDEQPIIAGFTAKQVGLLLLAAYTLFILAGLWRRPTRHNLLFAAALQGIGMFTLATQMHQRYVIPAIALATPLAVTGEAFAYFASMAVASVNQVISLMLLNRAYDGMRLRRGPFVWVNLHALVLFSAVNVLLLLWWTWRYARQTLLAPTTVDPFTRPGTSLSSVAIA